MDFAPGRSAADPALETLLLPFADGQLAWPEQGCVLFLQARTGAMLPAHARQWTCEQGFRPLADRLRNAGMTVVPEAEGGARYPMVLMLLPRQREQARALLARALDLAGPEGLVLASAANDEGARSAEADLRRLAGPVPSLSKNHCRVFWSPPGPRQLNASLQAEWRGADAPRAVVGGRFVSRPGVFAWDRIDTASAMLAECLPAELSGRGADLGAGYGFLSVCLLEHCPGIRSLDLFEADSRALALARVNVGAAARRIAPVALSFHWHDVAAGIPGGYDFIVSNPPFHQGKAGQPELGRSFIAAAAAALAPEGCLWLVANRHLPYEAELASRFIQVRTVRDEQGFKVIQASGARK